MSWRWRWQVCCRCLRPCEKRYSRRRRSNVDRRLAQISFDALRRVATDVTISDVIRADVQLLMAIDSLWGAEALSRVTFAPVEAASPSAFGSFLLPLRHT